MLENRTIFLRQCLECKELMPYLNKLKNTKWKNERPKGLEAYSPTQIEHLANIATHGVAIVPSALGLLFMCSCSSNWTQFLTALVYGATLVLLFSVSTCFHCVFYGNHNGQLKDTLHRCDRAMIYIFIAASYFPWLTLSSLPEDGWGVSLRWIIWVLASLGIVYQQTFHEKYKSLETCLYLMIGILPALAIMPEVDAIGLWELKLGGIFYTTGVVFFKADGSVPCAHAIWHLFVIMGASVHYYAILTHFYLRKLPLSYPN